MVFLLYPPKLVELSFFPPPIVVAKIKLTSVPLGLFRSETSDYCNSIDHVIFKEGSPRVVDGFAVLTNHISQWGNTSNVKYVCKI